MWGTQMVEKLEDRLEDRLAAIDATIAALRLPAEDEAVKQRRAHSTVEPFAAAGGAVGGGAASAPGALPQISAQVQQIGRELATLRAGAESNAAACEVRRPRDRECGQGNAAA
jgi:hypothetical protein